MRNFTLIFIGTFLISNTTFGQLTKEITNPDISGKLFKNSGRASLKIEGSPYLQKNYTSAKVTKINTLASMRYNVYRDEFEFISPKNDTLVLDKINDFSDLTILATNTKYQLVNYINENGKINYGYLIDLYQKGDFGLYKKENVLLSEEKIAKTSMEQNMPPKYFKSNDFYYLKNKNIISEFPSSKKN